MADTPDLLPVLDPSAKQDAPAAGEQSAGSSTADGVQSGVTSDEQTGLNRDANLYRIWSKPPNLTTEADEERLYLQGDFGPRRGRNDGTDGRVDGGVDGDASGTVPMRRRKRERRDGRASRRGTGTTPAGPSSKAARGVRERVLHFTPSWFSVTMGTGVIATLLNLLPWGEPLHSGLRWPALVWITFDAFL